MKQKISHNLVNFLISTEGESEEQIREYLADAGINPNYAIKKALEDIKERRAERKRTEGKRLQEEFNKIDCTEQNDKTETIDISIDSLALQFRNGEISEEEKKEIEERDRKKLERFRVMNKGGEKE
ncbi:MAG: hypothetical protein WC644_01875 [Ignavibacteria bacterium]